MIRRPRPATTGDSDFYGYSIYFMDATPGGAFCYAGDLVGGCCLGDPTAPLLAHRSAGRLTLTDETTDASGVIDWSPADAEYGFLSPAFPWTTSDRLTVEAAGDEVGAFVATTTFPAAIEGIASATEISLASDWTVVWTPTSTTVGAATMTVALFAGDRSLACRVDDADGELAIPADLLGTAFAAGPGVAIATRAIAGAADREPGIELRGSISLTSDVAFTP